ncbi:hypothetical protein [Lentzea sp. NPDC059081]|uniref:hypothetical protein n=1 Tax=Lentzea sp. NPDC059081 TaxID=3346719 RepID=UPI0036A3AD98
MPRTKASCADVQLATWAAQAGADISTRQIERWREQGLVPRNLKRSLGRGKGSTSEPAPGAADLFIWLAWHARPGRRPTDLVLAAFSEGLAVPEPTVRKAFATVIGNVNAAVGRFATAHEEMNPRRAVASSTLVPGRIRQIDRAIGAIVNTADPTLAALDSGFGAGVLTSAAMGSIAAHALREGADSIDLGAMAAIGRSLLPKGTAAPMLGLLEFNTPTLRLNDGSVVANEEGGLGFLPEGDFLDHLHGLAVGTPLDELLSAWHLAMQLPAWAIDLCERVEHELEVGTPSAAVEEWLWTSWGLGRSWLVSAIRDKNRPVDIAITTLMLIFTRDMVRWLRQNVADGRFDLLSHPIGLPRLLAPLLAPQA